MSTPLQLYLTVVKLFFQVDLDADELLRGRPILLARVDVHVYWASQKVIDALGELPDVVDGGEIERYEHGKPTGKCVGEFQG